MTEKSYSRFKYLCEQYRGTEDCLEAGFECDFKANDDDECPCTYVSKVLGHVPKTKKTIQVDVDDE